jgi:hypothetical protein
MTAEAAPGSTGTVFHDGGGSYLYGIAVNDEHVYFSRALDGSAEIGRIPVEGGDPELLYSSDPGMQPNIGGLQLEGDFLYFQDIERSGCARTRIKRLSLTTSGLDLIAEHDCILEMVALGDIVYFVTADPRSGPLSVGAYKAEPE